MMRRFLVAIVVSLFVLTCVTSAFAITGNDDWCNGVEFQETGVATFLLDNNGKLAGVLNPNEDVGKLGFQSSTNRYSPSGTDEEGRALRRRMYVRVCLDEFNYVSRGGKNLEVTITLTDLELVESIIEGEVTVESIIDATIYSPNLSCSQPYAAHIFLGQNSDRVKVGTVCFNNGRFLELYAGHFYGDCRLVLGFRAKPVEKAPEPDPCPCEPCDPCEPYIPPCPGPIPPPPPIPVPCYPCTPTVTVTTTTTTQVTTVTTTTVGVGGCK